MIARFAAVLALGVACAAECVPAAAAPHHLATMAFYQGVDENTDLPAAFMAQTYDWTEQSVFGDKAAAAFVHAGGKHAVVYTDPFVIFRCASASVGSCRDAEAFKNTLSVDALLHDASGTVLYNDDRHEQRLDYSGVPFLRGFDGELRSLIARSKDAWGRAAGGYVELDDLGNKNDVHRWRSVWPQAASVSSDAQIIAGKQRIVRNTAALSNVLLNGVNYDWPENYGALFDAVGKDAGAFFNENCFATDYRSGYLTDDDPVSGAWKNQENGILGVLARGYDDICWAKGAPAPDHRMYFLASFWLTYDPQHSVAFEEMCAPDPTPKRNCNTTWDDASVVPAHALASATASIDALSTGASGYARRFASCSDDGHPIGGCAAVVNSSGSASLRMPLSGYTRALRLSERSLYGGAHHTWVKDVPATLPPHAAAILAQ
jgi:hypothetical protein